MLNIFLDRHRLGLSRLFFLIVIGIALIANPWAGQHPWLLQAMKATGFVAVVIASLGRLWSSLYLCGYKNKIVVDIGPYSVVRNPLYLFSLLGVLGIGLTNGSILIVLLLVCFFVFLYPQVIRHEERNLTITLGESYVTYREKTPRIIPSFSRFKFAPQHTIHMKSVHSAFKDVFSFYIAWYLVQLIPGLHLSNKLPNLFLVF